MSKTKEQIEHNTTEEQTTYPCTDTGNIERFVDQHKNHIRSLGSAKAWLIWDGSRWKPSGYAGVFKYGVETVKSIPREVESAGSIQEAQKIEKWAETSENEPKTRAMMNMAANHPELLTSASAFDADKMKLNCLNGVVDLTTGKLLERDPNDLHICKQIDQLVCCLIAREVTIGIGINTSLHFGQVLQPDERVVGAVYMDTVCDLRVVIA